MNQDEAKTEILQRIKSRKFESFPLPEVPMYAYPGQPLEDFEKHLLGFDGRYVEFKTRDEAIAWLKKQPELEADKNVIYSTLAEVPGNFTDDDMYHHGNAQKIGTCVTEGELGVGEMGSIWVTNDSLKYAICALLARRLFILLDSGKILGGMHETYAKLDLEKHQYGAFFSGPSATADIEAVRITGAQGPLALTALIYNCESAPEPPKLVISPNADTQWKEEL